jgi:hypothetical protein
MSAGLWLNVSGVIDGKPTDPDIPMVWDATANRIIVSGTADWRKVEIVLDIPQEASYLDFGVTTGHFGHLWIDDMQLEVVGTDVPTTHRDSSLIKTTNLDFEQGLTNWITPTSSASEVGTGPEMARSGKSGAYLKYFGSSGAEAGTGIVYKTIYGQYYRDKTVSISAYVNMDNAPQGATLYLEALYLSGNGNNVSGTVTNTVHLLPSASGGQGWQRIEGTIDVPDRTWGLVFFLSLNGIGEIWVDDVQIDVLGPAPTPIQTPR